LETSSETGSTTLRQLIRNAKERSLFEIPTPKPFGVHLKAAVKNAYETVV